MSRVAKQPLDAGATRAADDQVYAAHEGDPRPNALYAADGTRRALDPGDPSQAALRTEWMDAYVANGGAVEADEDDSPPDGPTDPCPPETSDEEVEHYLYLPDRGHLLCETPYRVIDPDGRVASEGTSGGDGLIDVPERFGSGWAVEVHDLATISGRLETTAGEPLANETVEVLPWLGDPFLATTDADGGMTLESVAEGALLLRTALGEAVHNVVGSESGAVFTWHPYGLDGDLLRDDGDIHDALAVAEDPVEEPDPEDPGFELQVVANTSSRFAAQRIAEGETVTLYVELRRADDSVLHADEAEFDPDHGLALGFELDGTDHSELSHLVMWGEPYGHVSLHAKQGTLAVGRLRVALVSPADGHVLEVGVLRGLLVYMTEEIVRNVVDPDVQRCRVLNDTGTPSNKELANDLFARRVHTNEGLTGGLLDVWFLGGGDWDHKPILRPIWGARNRLGNSDHVYFYDVYSNFHYGYVGRAAGFTKAELIAGADRQQQVDHGEGDDTTDVDSIVAGFDAYAWKNFTVDDFVKVMNDHTPAWLHETRFPK